MAWLHSHAAIRRGLLGLATSTAVLVPHRRPRCDAAAPAPSVRDVIVVGGGLAGLAVTRELAVRGTRVELVERAPWLAAAASSGSSGLGHTGYDAPLGSLERRLLRRSTQIHQNLYRSFGLSYAHVRKAGSLVVAWTEEQLAKLPSVLEENREAGDEEARLLDVRELYDLEPGLGAGALGAVLCPREAVVEPWLVPMGYAESARLHGAELRTGLQVEAVDRVWRGGEEVWSVRLRKSPEIACDASIGRSHGADLHVAPPKQHGPLAEGDQGVQVVHARVLVNCAGLFGDVVECMRLRSQAPEVRTDALTMPFQVTPRKGQFVVFKPAEDPAHAPAPSYIIEPVASQFTKGVIAWTSIYGDIVVGPTAEPQEDREDRSTSDEKIAMLRAFGEKVVPAVRDAEVVGTYSGLRPATEFRDYQIVSRPEERWITVGGIRSTGLTGSAGIGEYVADLYDEMVGTSAGLVHGGVPEGSLPGVTAAANAPLPLQRAPKLWNGPVPTLEELAADYQRRGDGCVELYGRVQRVTHALSSFGMEAYVGSLAPS